MQFFTDPLVNGKSDVGLGATSVSDPDPDVLKTM
jgi:hypothetical protein